MTAETMRFGSPGPAESLRSHPFGPVSLAKVDNGALDQRDLVKVLGERDRGYAFVLLTRGAASLRHYGYDGLLGAGDFVLLDLAAAADFAFTEDGELIALCVPPRVLRTFLPSPDHHCGKRLDADAGIARGVAEVLQSVFAGLAEGIPAEFHGRIARNLLDMLATAFAMAQDGARSGSPVISSRNARARLKIEQNLRDPDLTPAAIAAQLRMSPRYLRAIFAAGDETVSAYILRRRLEECARELADPGARELSITQVAFGWGFNSAPHFTRSFRKRYGVSPREFRAERAR